MTTKPISNGETFLYATGSFGTGVFSTVPAVLLLYFCTETLHISGSVAATWTAVEKLGLALGAVLVGQTIDLIQGNLAVGIGLFVCVVPLTLCLLSTFFLNSPRKQDERATSFI